MKHHIQNLTLYKAWANERLFAMVSNLPAGEAVLERQTRYRNMVHTLNHVFVIDSVFKAHLLGHEHGYSARNTPTHPPLEILWRRVRVLDQWYIDYASHASPEELEKPIEFDFIGGGKGAMTAAEMILHVVNHGTYHRGLVSDMMYQAGVTPQPTDLTVFLRR
jgi:uncharacterized damage-inducible protein DinB